MGHLLIDDTVSGGKKLEADTTHCRHCQAVVVKPLRMGGVVIPLAAGGWCGKCAGQLCEHCAKESYELGMCKPWKQRIDEELDAFHHAKAGLIL